MTLAANVQARYAVAKLVQLTNPGDVNATTINTTILDLACTDVEAEFEITAGLDYDDTSALHVANAVEGVLVILRVRQRGEMLAVSDEYEKWRGALERLSMVTSRDRIIPQSSSQEVPSRFNENVQPVFDNQRFSELGPNRRRADQ